MRVYADIRVTAVCEEDLASFLNLCSVIQHQGDIGHCAELKVVVDGDGSGRYAFQIHKEEGGLEDFPSNGNWKEEDALWLGE